MTAMLKVVSIKNRKDLFVSKTNIYIQYIALEKLLKSLVISFENQYSSRNPVKKSKYQPLKKEYDDDAIAEEEDIYKELQFILEINKPVLIFSSEKQFCTC